MDAGSGELLKWFATLGVGGALAGLMFFFYRKDIRQFTDLWRTTAEQMILVVKENTMAQTKLITMIETQERNALRKDDVMLLLQKAGESHRSSEHR